MSLSACRRCSTGSLGHVQLYSCHAQELLCCTVGAIKTGTRAGRLTSNAVGIQPGHNAVDDHNPGELLQQTAGNTRKYMRAESAQQLMSYVSATLTKTQYYSGISVVEALVCRCSSRFCLPAVPATSLSICPRQPPKGHNVIL